MCVHVCLNKRDQTWVIQDEDENKAEGDGVLKAI
jgi:hypothetical protein